jgi:hypothetical protein
MPFAQATRPRLEIDFAALKRKSFLTPDAPQSPLADEFRIVQAADHAQCARAGESPQR